MNIHQIILILQARYKIILYVLSITVLTTTAVSLILPKSYVASSSVVIDVKGVDPIAGSPLPMQLMPGYIPTQVDIISSRRVALRVVQNLKLTESAEAQRQFKEEADGKGTVQDWLADLLVKKLDVVPSRESSVIQITYTASDPQFAALLANAFAQAYIDTNLELKVDPARQTASWFNDRSQQLRLNLERAQAKLSAYQREKGIVAPDERMDIENARLSELSSQLVQNQAQTYDSATRQKQVKEFINNSQSPENLPDMLATASIQGLKTDMLREEAKLKEIASQLGKNHPLYQRQMSEVEGLRQKLNQELKTVASGADNTNHINQQRESQIKNALAAQKNKVLNLKQQRDELTVLNREVENAQRTYDLVMQRFNQTNLESQANQTNISILNPAVEPRIHSRPKILLNIMLSFVLGSMLSFALVFLLEMADRRVRSVKDMGEDLGVPVLGSLKRENKGRFNLFEFIDNKLLRGATS